VSAIVIDSGSRLRLLNDKTGFLFVTNELHPSNDVLIEVVSDQPPEVIFESVQP
jgi:hypothetical protein